MKTLIDLYNLIDEKEITLINFTLTKTKSISLKSENNHCYIGIDYRQIKNYKELKTRLYHEVGHCVKGAFYNRHSKLDLIEKHEHRANKWSVENLLPFCELKCALKNGIIEVWELAQYFNLTDDFIKLSIKIYTQQGLLPICECEVDF